MNKLLRILSNFDYKKYPIIKIVIEDKGYFIITTFILTKNRFIEMSTPEILLIQPEKELVQTMIIELEKELEKVKKKDFKDTNI